MKTNRETKRRLQLSDFNPDVFSGFDLMHRAEYIDVEFKENDITVTVFSDGQTALGLSSDSVRDCIDPEDFAHFLEIRELYLSEFRESNP